MFLSKGTSNDNWYPWLRLLPIPTPAQEKSYGRPCELVRCSAATNIHFRPGARLAGQEAPGTSSFPEDGRIG